MTFRTLTLTAAIAVAPVLLAGQQQPPTPPNQGGLDPASIGKPLADSWPTYSGDYTGRRYSSLTQINQTTVKNLTLAWVGRVSGPPGAPGAGGFGGFGGGRGGGGGAPLIVGGEGADDMGGGAGGVTIKGAVLQVEGVLYACAPDHVWALDARDGHELWHYFWKTKGSTHIGCRGVGMWHNHIYVETPDDYLVSLDARTGKENWHVPLASFEEQYFSTMALIAVDVDTGKMKWYYQTSPHDTHDWDSAQTPILVDATINGRPRKLVSTAARNGYFFTVDRVTGEHIATVKYGTTVNWAKGIRENGAPDPNPEKEATIPGSLVSPVEGGVTNWQPSAYSPDTGLFYAQENNGFNFVYLTDPDPRGSMGLGGKLTSP